MIESHMRVLDALRVALRRLAHRPALTAGIVIILAVGIAVSTAVFSVAQRLLVRPIPVPELSRLVVAWETDPSREGSLIEVSWPYFLDWRDQNRSFEDMAAYGSVNWGFEFKERPAREARVRGVRVRFLLRHAAGAPAPRPRVPAPTRTSPRPSACSS